MNAGALIFLAAIVVAAIIAILLFARKSAPTLPPPAGTASELQKVKVQYVIDGDTVIVSKFWGEI